MAFLLNKTTLASHFRSQSQANPSSFSRRGFHVEPGTREKALLADDPSLRRFRSNKKSVALLKKVGDILTLVVVAGCCYEIYVKATMREEARQATASSASNELLSIDE